jgi:hypothetical protein
MGTSTSNLIGICLSAANHRPNAPGSGECRIRSMSPIADNALTASWSSIVKKAFLLVLLSGTPGLLSACTSGHETGGVVGLPLTVGQARPDGVCGGQYTEMKRGGGKLFFQLLNGNFAARFDYAPYKERKAKFSTELGEGNVDCFGTPVPPGYTAVWFGSISVDEGKALQFQNKPTGRCTIQSNTFQQGTQYYLYVYDDSGNVLYSNSIGTPDRGGSLNFTSPFEDGFLIPGVIYLEIVDSLAPYHKASVI